MAPAFSLPSLRGAVVDLAAFPLVRDPDKRLHAVDGLNDIDTLGIIGDVRVAGPIDPMPGGAELAELARPCCRAAATPGPA